MFTFMNFHVAFNLVRTRVCKVITCYCKTCLICADTVVASSCFTVKRSELNSEHWYEKQIQREARQNSLVVHLYQHTTLAKFEIYILKSEKKKALLVKFNFSIYVGM
jgi:hypothetical protein